MGDRDKGIDALVRALTLEGLRPIGTSGAVADDFHEGVASAVTEFQEKYASEILTPNGLRRGNGYVGPSTRAKLNALYECRATPVTPLPTPVTQPSITVTYPQAGYSLYNGLGKGDGTPATNPIATITWTSSNVGDFSIEIALLNTSGSIVKYIATGLQNTGSYRWLYDSTIPSGNYTLLISSRVRGGAGRSGTFSIVSDAAATAQPSIINFQAVNTSAGMNSQSNKYAYDVNWSTSAPVNATVTMLCPLSSGSEMITLGDSYSGTLRTYPCPASGSALAVGTFNGASSGTVKVSKLNGSPVTASFTLSYGAVGSVPTSRIISVALVPPGGSALSSETMATKEAVANYYRELLKREPEAGGVEYWMGTGLSLEKVKQGIIASYEYSTKQQIGNTYRELLGRSPNDGELTYWYNKRYVEKNTLSQVREGIMASSEYQNRATVSASNVQQTITVTSPVGAETYTIGETRRITWNSSGTSIGKVSLWLCRSGECARLSNIPAMGITNTGYYDWTVGTAPYTGAALRIRVASEDQYPTSTVYDDSELFVVTSEAAQPSITVTAPTSGQTIEGKAGTSFEVRWTTENWSPDTLVNIDTVYYPGGVVERARSAIQNSGSATININKNSTENKTLRMRVSAVKSGILTAGESAESAYFTITPPTVSAATAQPSITVTSPNGGETLELGKPYTFRWSTTGDIGPVDILIKDVNEGRSSALQSLTVATGVMNTGSYIVTLPTDTTYFSTNARFGALNYKVRLYGVCNSCANTESVQRVTDESNSVFILKKTDSTQPSVTVVSPNGGEIWAIGSRQTVTVRTTVIPSNIVPSAYFKNADTGARIEGVAFAALDSTNRTLTVTVPSTVSAGRYYVEALAWYEGQWYSDQSDSAITITAPATSRRDALNALASAFAGFEGAIEEIRMQFPE